MRRWIARGVLAGIITATVVASASQAAEFRSAWPRQAERVWVGPEYWANRLEDWRIAGGRLECTMGGPDRNVNLLTHQLGAKAGDFTMSVRLGRLGENVAGGGFVGFRFGIKGQFNDYRDSAVRGSGMNAGVTTTGSLFIGDGAIAASAKGAKAGKAPKAGKKAKAEQAKPAAAVAAGDVPLDEIELTLKAEPQGAAYLITLTAKDKAGKMLQEITRENVAADSLVGNVALVCSGGDMQNPLQFWFADWRVAGSKIEAHPEQTFGPILFSQYTLSRGVLKMTAQMAPIGKNDAQTVRLQIRAGNDWKTISEAPIDNLARTATFRIEKWDSSRDVPYRLAYTVAAAGDQPKDYEWTGTVRHDPVEKETIVVAGFTGNNDLGFPHADVAAHVAACKPDFLVFTGDQIYEAVGGYGVQRAPLDVAVLDYLRKWYLWGWEYRELTRDIPCVALPDDHDVFHGNLWGAGGRHAPTQDDGGYTMPPDFVKMVERTQTSHMPDPYDPTPVEQGIGVYYCAVNWGGVSFAVIEDRKFKSCATPLVPEGQNINGFFRNKAYDPRKADVPGAELLGERQLKFLRDWAGDWSHGAQMKCVISQTIFADVATLPTDHQSDQGVPKLRVFAPGEYPEDDIPTADTDTNGWPQTPRNKALREMRRGFAFHLAGDQHLATVTQYGVEDWGDAAYAFCVPAVANIWPRRWMPQQPGLNHQSGKPRYTGDYLDAFGNRVSVFAAANPYASGRQPAMLHDRATGFGVVKFNKRDRTIAMDCWPRYADPNDPKTGGQYPDWPVVCKQEENYGRKAVAWLPTVEVSGLSNPVVQVIDESNGELIYALRIKGATYRPKVFKEGAYTLIVGEPDKQQMKTLKGVKSLPADKSETLRVAF